MDLKLFRSFTPYVNRANKPVTMKDFDHLRGSEGVIDPSGQQWTTGGFCHIDGNEFVVDIQGAGFMAMMQINERILPASVVKEAMVERIAEIEKRDQRKANKKDFAQIKEEVVGTLLPKAFIKRTFIPVMFVKGRNDTQFCLVFTSSAKKADDVMQSLVVALHVWGNSKKRWAPWLLSKVVVDDIATKLMHAAEGGALQNDDPECQQYLQVHKSVALVGANKQAITIKEKDIGSAEVQNILKGGGYDVKKIGLEFYDGDVDSAAEMVINDNLVCSGFKCAGASSRAKEEAESFNNVWVIARTAADMLSTLVDVMSGLKEKGGGAGADTLAAEDDENNLVDEIGDIASTVEGFEGMDVLDTASDDGLGEDSEASGITRDAAEKIASEDDPADTTAAAVDDDDEL